MQVGAGCKGRHEAQSEISLRRTKECADEEFGRQEGTDDGEGAVVLSNGPKSR